MQRKTQDVERKRDEDLDMVVGSAVECSFYRLERRPQHEHIFPPG
jgi:hypothetical protein